MKILTALCMTFAVCTLSAQTQVHYEELEDRDGVSYHDGVRFTGEAYGRANITNDPMRMQFVDGRAQGYFTGYYDEGRTVVRFRVPMANGKKNGMYIHYHNNGNIMFKANTRNDLLEGKRYCYTEEGALWHIHNYRCGKQNGIMRTYNSDGTLYVRKRYRNDVLNGLCRMYQKDGAHEKGRFRNDKREGVWRIYDAQGKLVRKIMFRDGEQKKVIERD